MLLAAFFRGHPRHLSDNESHRTDFHSIVSPSGDKNSKSLRSVQLQSRACCWHTACVDGMQVAFRVTRDADRGFASYFLLSRSVP